MYYNPITVKKKHFQKEGRKYRKCKTEEKKSRISPKKEGVLDNARFDTLI